MSNLATRTLTGFLFIVMMVGALWLGQFTFLALITLIAIVGLFEYYILIKQLNAEPRKIIGFFWGIFILVIIFSTAKDILNSKWLLLLILIPITISFIELTREQKQPIQNIVYSLFGLIYIPLSISLSSYLVFNTSNESAYNPEILLSVFILIWSYDTFAYLTGKFFGKHKLLERISPKKTWEGTIGGILLSLGVAVLIYLSTNSFSLYHWLIISFIISITGNLGDLTQSAIKRKANVKDSGKLLPGHGGILDRFDAAFFAIPSVFLYVKVFII